MRIAAVGDLHCRKTFAGQFAPILAQVDGTADVLLLCGDLTDHGLEDEARVLAKELATVRIPMIGVLGNHDYQSGADAAVSRVLVDAGVQLLDGDAVEVHGIGFAGAKGFVGGFGRGTLGPWGESAIRRSCRRRSTSRSSSKSRSSPGSAPTGASRSCITRRSARRAWASRWRFIRTWAAGASRSRSTGFRSTWCSMGTCTTGPPRARRHGIPVYNVALPLLRAHEAPVRACP